MSYLRNEIVGAGTATGWTQNGTNIIYSQGNVGIGTNNPTNTLSVKGSINVYGDIPCLQVNGKTNTILLNTGGSQEFFITRPIGTQAAYGLPENLTTGSQFTYFNDEAVAVLTDPNGTGTNFGYASAMSADGLTLLVGAPASVTNTGKAFVFRYSGGNWSAAVQIGSGAAINSNYGCAVSISADGNSAVVGSNTFSTNIGEAYLYNFTGGSWVQTVALRSLYTISSGVYYGTSVSLSGDGTTVAVGSNGFIYIYSYNGTSWVFNQTLGSVAGTGFGWSLSLNFNATKLLTGNPFESTFYTNAGAIYIYFKINGVWVFKNSSSANPANCYWGFSVSISADGSTGVAGQPQINIFNPFVLPFRINQTTGIYNYTSSTSYATNTNYGRSVAFNYDGSAYVAGGPSATPGFISYTILNSAGTNIVINNSINLASATFGALYGTSSCISYDGAVVAGGCPGTSSIIISVLYARYKVNNTLNVFNKKLGIGVTNPGSPLQILCGDNYVQGISFSSEATNAAGASDFMIQRGPSVNTTGGIAWNTSNVMTFHTPNETVATVGPVGYLWMSSGSRLGMFYDVRNSRLGIGTTSPTNPLHIYNNAGLTNLVLIENISTNTNDVFVIKTGPNTQPGYLITLRAFSNPTVNFIKFIQGNGTYQPGQITSTSATTMSYGSASDYRLKSNVTPLVNSIDFVRKFKPINFTFNSNPENIAAGFLAHEFQELIPTAVSGVKDGINSKGEIVSQSLDNSYIIPYLTGAIQELSAELESLKSRLSALEAK